MPRFSHSLKLACLCLSSAWLLNACGEPPKHDFSTPSFAGQQQIELDVTRIDVDNDHVPTAEEQSLLRYFPMSPAQAVESWARERLWAVGGAAGEYRAAVHIVDATIKRMPRPEKSRSSKDRYFAHLDVEVNIYGQEKASRVASVNTEVSIEREISENASDNAHRAFFAGITRDLLKDMDKNLSSSMPMYFQPFLAYGKNGDSTLGNTQTIMPANARIESSPITPPVIKAEPYQPSSPEPKALGTLHSDKPF